MSIDNPESLPPFNSEPRRPQKTQETSGREQQERKERTPKETVLAYLVETGRATTPEEAEHYLETINRIKEKLLVYAKDEVLRQKAEEAAGHKLSYGVDGVPWIGDEWGINRINDRPDVIENMTPKEIDRNAPHIWRLSRSPDPFYSNLLPENAHLLGTNGVSVSENLGVNLKEADIVIRPSPFVALELKKYLSQEDLQFLTKEYAFARQDLAKTMRAIADEVASNPEFQDSTWRDYWPIKEHNERT